MVTRKTDSVKKPTRASTKKAAKPAARASAAASGKVRAAKPKTGSAPEKPKAEPVPAAAPMVAGQTELVSLAEMAQALRMSPVQVQKMAQTRQIPAVKVDGEWRFNKDLVYEAIHRRSRGF